MSTLTASSLSKSAILSITPRHHFSFNNTRDIQILRLHNDSKSPFAKAKTDHNNTANNGHHQKSPVDRSSKPAKKVPGGHNKGNSSRASVSRGSVETAYFALFTPPLPEIKPQSPTDMTGKECVGNEDFNQPHESESPAKAEDKSAGDQNRFEDKPIFISSHQTDEDGKHKEESSGGNPKGITKTHVLPVLVVNSRENTPDPTTSKRPTPTFQDSMRTPSVVPVINHTQSVRVVRPPRRRGYVVEKRQMMNHHRPFTVVTRRQSGGKGALQEETSTTTRSNSPPKKLMTLEVEDRSDTELTFVHQQNDDENDRKSCSDEQEADEVDVAVTNNDTTAGSLEVTEKDTTGSDDGNNEHPAPTTSDIETEPDYIDHHHQEIMAERSPSKYSSYVKDKAQAKDTTEIDNSNNENPATTTSDIETEPDYIGRHQEKITRTTSRQKSANRKQRSPSKYRSYVKEKAQAKDTKGRKASAKRAPGKERESVKDKASTKVLTQEKAYENALRLSHEEKKSAEERSLSHNEEDASENDSGIMEEDDHHNAAIMSKKNKETLNKKSRKSAPTLRNISPKSPSSNNFRVTWTKKRAKSSRCKWKPLGGPLMSDASISLRAIEELVLARKLLGPALC